MEKTNELGNNIKREYAIITDRSGTLNIFPTKYRPNVGISDTLLSDVEIQTRSDGSLRVIGNQIEEFYNGYCFGEPLTYEELKKANKYVLDKSKVYQSKFLWWKIGEVKYYDAWIEIKERKSFEVVTSNYRITKYK